ncbi:amidohydrolase [uncultured Vibrio sp.]|uniref:amidohydrolase n=1 Tax=uncultured Vibrio sp. TaxID=114054 RepID=UPI0025D24B70|nr:amidohydrolase [uncultured Vibrio sp.]
MKLTTNKTLITLSLAAAISGCSQLANTNDTAEAIYYGGTVITMNDDSPIAQSVAVSDGKIIAVGDEATIKKNFASSDTNLIDLDGHTLMPGFIDSHSHFVAAGMKKATVEMDPAPAGRVNNIKDIQNLFSWELAKRDEDSTDWLIGTGYDAVFLEEGRHPTRHDLDAISTDTPILLIHFSGHQAVANSYLLEMMNIDENTLDPEGGTYQREDGSNVPNGVLEEAAWFPFYYIFLQTLGHDLDSRPENFIQDLTKALVVDIQKDYAQAGYTTITEQGMVPSTYHLVKELADNNKLYLDVGGSLFMKGEDASVEDIRAIYSAEYENHFRVLGGKASLDGGTPGRTGYLREAYQPQFEGEENYAGFLSMSVEQYNRHISEYYQADIPLYVHALGDAALDVALDGIEAALEVSPTGEYRRTQLIHTHLIADEQFDRIEAVDSTITFQMPHSFYYADFHASQRLGVARTEALLPAKTAFDRGISTTIHHDAPVSPIGQLDLISQSVNRTSRSGKVWGADERLSVMEALKASTINAAYQYYEEDRKGSLEVGKLADMVILDSNPLEIEPALLKDIQVIETIKEGNTVYSIEQN